MDTIFMNSENSRTSDFHKLLLDLSQKELINMLLYEALAFTIHRKIYNSCTKIINLKSQLRHGIKSLNYLMDHILYDIFCMI